MYGLGIIIIILFVPAAIMLKYVPMRERPYKVLTEATAAAALGILFVFVLASSTGVSLGERLGEMSDQAINILLANESFMNNSALAEMSADEIRKALSVFYTLLINSLPGILLIITAIFSYIEYILITKALASKVDNIRKLPEFKNFTLPKSALWGWLTVFGAAWLVSRGFDIGEMVLINIGILMEFSFVVQGSAVIFYFMDSRRIPKPVAVIIIFLFISTRMTQTLLFTFGVVDLVFNFRSRMNRKSL